MDPAQERNTILALLQAESDRLLPVLSDRLVPPEGLAFGYALRGARDSGGVAVIAGGITRGPSGNSAGPCMFGRDEAVVRIILTTLKFDPGMRSAAILMYSDQAVTIFEDDLFLECRSVTPGARNPGISTMDWGIAACCGDGVPDIILQKGPSVQDSRIIMFGEDPADVSNNIIICSNRI